MVSTEDSSVVNEVTVRKWVTIIHEERTRRLLQAHAEFQLATHEKMLRFDTLLNKLESSMHQTAATIKKTQHACKFLYTELAMLKGKRNGGSKDELEQANKFSREEESSQQGERLEHLVAQINQKFAALEQETRMHNIAASLFSLQVEKLTDEQRTKCVQQLEVKQSELRRQVQSEGSEWPELAKQLRQQAQSEGSESPELVQQLMDQLAAYEPIVLQRNAPQQGLIAESTTGKSDRESAVAKNFVAKLENLEVKIESQQLAANIFCLRSMDADQEMRDASLEEKEHHLRSNSSDRS
eukprot:TRINITY_DN73411_c0_g1_i1.p1 TRINITY_DN73411_c0_g1~~TRINITY_DN73411_c0_g1_i1.p1  ORF type:complete len:297 (+),score=74.30 TRINITY_DN73411_c0_g1_i1:58-948(+)